MSSFPAQNKQQLCQIFIPPSPTNTHRQKPGPHSSRCVSLMQHFAKNRAYDSTHSCNKTLVQIQSLKIHPSLMPHHYYKTPLSKTMPPQTLPFNPREESEVTCSAFATLRWTYKAPNTKPKHSYLELLYTAVLQPVHKRGLALVYGFQGQGIADSKRRWDRRACCFNRCRGLCANRLCKRKCEAGTCAG